MDEGDDGPSPHVGDEVLFIGSQEVFFDRHRLFRVAAREVFGTVMKVWLAWPGGYRLLGPFPSTDFAVQTKFA